MERPQPGLDFLSESLATGKVHGMYHGLVADLLAHWGHQPLPPYALVLAMHFFGAMLMEAHLATREENVFAGTSAEDRMFAYVMTVVTAAIGQVTDGDPDMVKDVTDKIRDQISRKRRAA